MGFQLDDIGTGSAELDAVFRSWREAIETLSRWFVAGDCTFSAGPEGFKLLVHNARGVITAFAGEDGISAAPDSSSYGTGYGMLMYRVGTAGEDGETVDIFSDFRVGIPGGTRMVVVPDGEGYRVVGADCPLE